MRTFLMWYDEVPPIFNAMKGKQITIKRKGYEPEKILVNEFLYGFVNIVVSGNSMYEKQAFIGLIDSNHRNLGLCDIETIDFDSEEYVEYTYPGS